MKKIALAGLLSLLCMSSAANAISLGGEAGEQYTNITVGFGTNEPGLAFTGNWAHNDNEGEIVGLGVGFNFPLGPLMATAGGKAVYLNPDKNDQGYAAAVGGGLQWAVMDNLRLFGEYYYSPESLSSGVANYEEANAGVRFTIMRQLHIEGGYRYINLSGKNGNVDTTIADGGYVGVSTTF